MRKTSHRSGFTLIELLVVIAIIGIFASIVIAAINVAGANSRDSQRLVNVKNMQVAIERYYDANNSYPCTANSCPSAGIPPWWGNCQTFGSHSNTGPTGYIPDLSPTYLPKLPIDPKQTTGTCYLYASNGLDYFLMAYGTVEGTVPAQYKRPAYPAEQDYTVYTAGATNW